MPPIEYINSAHMSIGAKSDICTGMKTKYLHSPWTWTIVWGRPGWGLGGGSSVEGVNGEEKGGASVICSTININTFLKIRKKYVSLSRFWLELYSL